MRDVDIVIEGRACACGAIQPTELDGVGEIKRLFTRSDARGRGCVRAVLSRLEGIARDEGWGDLRLSTGTRQPEAIVLYEKSGWTRILPYGSYIDDQWSICFGKDL